MSVPVLVVAFNRPDTLEVLLRTLRAQGVSDLYFAVDGPRAHRPEDGGKVEQVKRLIEELYAPPPERCLYQTSNLGIRWAPPAAISWFFGQVDAGVILEDDCIPGNDFFPFMEWALDEFRGQERVKLVSGFNRFTPQPWSESFHFVKSAIIWGWASWRRAWKDYEPEMQSWDDTETQRLFRQWAGAFPVYDSWRVAIDDVRTGRLITWDVAWCWTVFRQRGLAVMPRVSLVQNIGFGLDSTNTSGVDERALVREGTLSPPYLGPGVFEPDLVFQRALDKKEFWRTDDTAVGRLRRWARVVKGWMRAR